MVTLRIRSPSRIRMNIRTQERFTARLSAKIVQNIVTEPYEGSYEFTPTEEDQEIEISGKTAEQNIVLHSIPANYGRLTWEAGSLKVY